MNQYNTTLNELGAEFRVLHQTLSDFDGDVTDEVKEKYIDALLNQINERRGDIGAKVDGYVHVMTEFDNGADACDAEIARLKVLSARRRANRQWLEDKLKRFLLDNFTDSKGKTKLDTPLHSLTVVGVGGVAALEVDDVSLEVVPEPMITIIPEQVIPEQRIINKNAVRDYCVAVENEVEIAGKKLEPLQWARILPRKKKLNIK